MATTLFTPFVRPSASSFSSNAAGYICKSCRRNVATARRTRKALRVKGSDSFAPSRTETQDHIIFNPPPSIANVYHTPPKFLPKSDPRRAMHERLLAMKTIPTPAPSAPASAISSIAAARQAATTKALPNPVRPVYEKKYHLGEDEVKEIQRLRNEDPQQWTRERLAEKFDCSQFFVSLCCSSPRMKDLEDARQEEAKRKWGRRKREAREDRQERKKLWGLA